MAQLGVALGGTWADKYYDPLYHLVDNDDCTWVVRAGPVCALVAQEILEV